MDTPQIIEKTRRTITPFKVVLLIAIASVGFIAWQFGWKKVEAGIYNKGVTAGINQVRTSAISEVCNTGKLNVSVPIKDGACNLEGVMQTVTLSAQK